MKCAFRVVAILLFVGILALALVAEHPVYVDFILILLSGLVSWELWECGDQWERL